jgi:peptide/nickel transport system substrate-binding protein
MKKSSFFFVLSAIIFAIFSFASVSNPNTVIYEHERAAETLDPHMVIDTASFQVLSNIYETLIEPDGTSLTKYKPVLSTNVPSIAEGTLRDEGKTYVFHVRQGVHFQNGDLLTPEDVVYSLERDIIVGMAGGNSHELTEPMLPKINGSYVSNITQWAVKFADVKKWDDLFASDTRTPKNEKYKQALVDTFNLLAKDFEIKGNDVIIHLPHSYSPFFNSIIDSVAMILDKKWAVAHGAWPGTAETWWKYYNPTRQKDPLYSITNGTGPFEIYKWVKGREVILKRFENYWGKPAKIEYVDIKTVPEFTTRKLDLIRGNADIISVPPQFMGQVKNIKGVVVSKNIPELAEYQISFSFSVNPHSKYIYSGKLDGNGVPPDFFSDLNVRKGFEYVFPHQIYIQQVWNGLGIEPNSPISKGLLGYDPNMPMYHQDLDKAAEYFKKAYNGQLWQKGFKVAIIYNSTDPTMKQACEILKDFTRRVNPKFKVIPVPMLWASLVGSFLKNELPMIALDWFGTSSYDRVYGYLSSHGVYGIALGKKFRDFAQKEFDPLINAAVSATNASEAEKVYKEIGMKTYEQAVMIWLIQPSRQLVYRDWLKGLYPDNYNPFRDKDLVFYNLYK